MNTHENTENPLLTQHIFPCHVKLIRKCYLFEQFKYQNEQLSLTRDKLAALV